MNTQPTLEEFHETMLSHFPTSYTTQHQQLVHHVVFLDSLASYEEETGLAVYQDSQHQYFAIEFGHCVMCSDLPFQPIPVSESTALEMIAEMEETIRNG